MLANCKCPAGPARSNPALIFLLCRWPQRMHTPVFVPADTSTAFCLQACRMYSHTSLAACAYKAALTHTFWNVHCCARRCVRAAQQPGSSKTVECHTGFESSAACSKHLIVRQRMRQYPRMNGGLVFCGHTSDNMTHNESIVACTGCSP